MVNKGEVLSTLPDAPLSLEIVRDLNSNDRSLLAKPLPDTTAGIDTDDPADVDGDDDNETTRRIAIQTSTGGYLVEYLPPDGWVMIRSVNATGRTEDEIADALMELAAETPSAEYLDELMQTGYDLLDDHNTVAACKRWLEVWEALKPRFTREMTSISDAERVFTGVERLYNWCQDFEMYLGNAGHTDASFHERRIEYCREFCELFPDSHPLIIQNMRSAAAVSLFALGRVEEGEQAFEALLDDHPEYGWGYIKWGDVYWFATYDEVPTDYDRAEDRYRTALELDFDDKDAAWNRLDDLADERAADTQER